MIKQMMGPMMETVLNDPEKMGAVKNLIKGMGGPGGPGGPGSMGPLASMFGGGEGGPGGAPGGNLFAAMFGGGEGGPPGGPPGGNPFGAMFGGGEQTPEQAARFAEIQAKMNERMAKVMQGQNPTQQTMAEKNKNLAETAEECD